MLTDCRAAGMAMVVRGRTARTHPRGAGKFTFKCEQRDNSGGQQIAMAVPSNWNIEGKYACSIA